MTKCHLLGQTLRKFVRLDVHVHGLGARDALTFGFQRLDQTEIVEHRRMQSVRKIVHVLAQLHQCPARSERRASPEGDSVASGKLGGVDGQSGEPLRNIVVQLAREPAAFVFMRGDQASAQGLCFSLGAAAADTLPHKSDR